MALKLMYITNSSEVALIAERSGVDCIFVDMETLGKAERQGHMDSVKSHHTVEDIGIALGDAFKAALGDMRGITRYGSFILPMDEALIMTAVDISGRAHLSYDLTIPPQKVGDFDTELAEEFYLGFVRHAAVTLHIKELSGTNSHHIIEGAFKSVARSLAAAVKIDENRKDEIPSTKGVL